MPLLRAVGAVGNSRRHFFSALEQRRRPPVSVPVQLIDASAPPERPSADGHISIRA
jgi:hypothetical protein